MSRDTPKGPVQDTNPRLQHQPDGKWKWLAGGAAAVILLGGGFYAWKAMEPRDPAQSDLAYNDAGYRTQPVDVNQPNDDPNAETALSDEPPRPPIEPATRRSPHRQAAHAAPASVEPAEQVIGVGPTNLAYDDAAFSEEEDIIVQGRQLPVWSRAPSSYHLASAYPTYARELGREGEASLACTILEGGALDCARTSETEAGFGRAAIRAATMFRHAPERADGSSAVGAPVNLHFVFRLQDDPNRGSRL